MTDQKKYTLEGDLRDAATLITIAMELSVLTDQNKELRDRLNKWADGQDPNEPDVDLRGLKVGDEVTFDDGEVAVTTHVDHDSSLRPDHHVVIGVVDATGGNYYHYDGTPYYVSRRIISYRTPPFDFQRSYDRGVRRFKKRDGKVVEVHWFKDPVGMFPVRDAFGNRWTAAGRSPRDLTLKGHTLDLIAEAPADVQPEDEA